LIVKTLVCLYYYANYEKTLQIFDHNYKKKISFISEFFITFLIYKAKHEFFSAPALLRLESEYILIFSCYVRSSQVKGALNLAEFLDKAKVAKWLQETMQIKTCCQKDLKNRKENEFGERYDEFGSFVVVGVVEK
jgi:hypothetical protein